MLFDNRWNQHTCTSLTSTWDTFAVMGAQYIGIVTAVATLTLYLVYSLAGIELQFICCDTREPMAAMFPSLGTRDAIQGYLCGLATQLGVDIANSGLVEELDRR